AVAGQLETDARTVVFGHSLGGVVGLLLQPVRAVVGLGIKVEGSARELGRARALAQRPPARGGAAGGGAARDPPGSGLGGGGRGGGGGVGGVVGGEDRGVDGGLRERDGEWGLAMDAAAFAVGAPDMPALLAGTGATVVLARGADDPMNTDDQLVRLGAPT